MSLLFGRQQRSDASDLVAARTRSRHDTGTTVSRSKAQRHSVIWAGAWLYARTAASLPLDVFRRIDGVQVEQPKPPVLLSPGGADGMSMQDFMAASTFDLRTVGNTVGVIRGRDALGLPAVIELADQDKVSLRKRDGVEMWVIDGTEYDVVDVWHEKLIPVSGHRLGLSPIAAAALAVNTAVSASEFVHSWFGGSATPAQHLKNTAKTLTPRETRVAKARYAEMLADGDVFVSGSDWTLSNLSAKASEAGYLEAIDASSADVARFVGVPGDLVDLAVKGSSITYANITQRNLQWLILHLGPDLRRREATFSDRLLPRPRYCKFNTAALLQMDPKTQMDLFKVAIDARVYTPSYVRDLLNLPPLSDVDLGEFAALFPNKAPTPTGAPQ